MPNHKNEIEEFEFKMQADAVARALALLGEGKYSLNNIIQLLSDAEQRAQFVCGFVDMNKDDSFKVGLENRLVQRGVVLRDENGKLSLTEDGEKRSAVRLPEPIESNLTE